MGPVETGLPAGLTRAMLAGPWLHPEVADRVRREIAIRLPEQRLPAPKMLAAPEDLRVKPRPVLHLLAGDLPFDPHRAAGANRSGATGQITRAAIARLSFGYGPVTVRPP